MDSHTSRSDDLNQIDWRALKRAAHDAARHAYAPYSGLAVGAAGLTEEGRTVIGCNVENASYGLTLCAECGLISNFYASGASQLIALTVVDASGRHLMPCGRCRQLLLETGGPGLLIDSETGPTSLSELLPAAFTRDELESRRAD